MTACCAVQEAKDMSAYTQAEMGYVCGTMLLGAIVNSVPGQREAVRAHGMMNGN